MSRYRVELATAADDGPLRAVLAATPMPGAIAVSFRREPSYFAAAEVDGRFHQAVAARDPTGRIVGCGARSVSRRYVNGQPAEIGYLSGLRILEGHRGLGLLARGYAFLHQLHADGRTPLYLTTIATDNRTAQSVLTSRRTSLPAYHDAGRYHTAAIRLRGATGCGRALANLEIRPARRADRPAIADFFHRIGPGRQFFPCYEAEDLFSDRGVLRGLAAEDVLLAFRGGQLVGTLAGWDQHAFRQIVVHDYRGPLRWGGPVYDAWAWIRGLPPLPTRNEPLRHLVAAIPLVAGDDPDVFAELLRALVERRRRGPWQYLLVGAHQSDPLLSAVRRFPAATYTTNLYLACWQDGERFRQSLDARPVYLELGSL